MPKDIKSKDIKSLSRRRFLSGCAALCAGGSGLLPTLTGLRLAHALTPPAGDYKALVCVFLFGGNDAFNMLVPYQEEFYNLYNGSRQTLAITRDSLLPINADLQAYHAFGLHPQLPNLQNLYTNGKLAFLANVGALVEPVTKPEYQSRTVQLPPQLFSHNDQQNFVQSLQSHATRNGWAGRAADVLAGVNANQNLSMNISLSGSNLWQSGAVALPYSVNPGGVVSFSYTNRSSDNPREAQRVQAFENLLAQSQDHLFARVHAGLQQNAWDLADEVGAALAGAPALTTVFPQGRLAQSLQMTARMIAARNNLGVSRQTFFIGIGDYDTHGNQLPRHTALLAELDGALKAFYDATVELGVAGQVTTFTASDFGRTLTSNGDGTDHAWGSHQIVLGGAVNGGDIYGTMPDLYIGSNNDIGEGRIIPTLGMDQYGATLAKWFGLPEGNFGDVFPNLSKFDATDLGFMLSA
jgi:uncharacterized protein (DUF1501 family)